MATDDAGTTISSAPNMSQCTQKCKWCSRGTCPVDVTKYHACHVKRRWMSPSATPATPTAAASPRSTPIQVRHRSQCHFSEAQIHEHLQLQQHYQRWRHRSVLDLPSDCGKCSNVAPTESRQHKNSGNRLHRKCFDLSWMWSFFFSVDHMAASGARSSHCVSIHPSQS